jgi:magnesium-transporting ATPase (P-type)
MASDYSIGQFRFLAKLLLVHGRWNYRRIVRVILYFFYKNVVFGVSILFYNALSMFSGFLVYDAVFSSTYNVLFTFLPVRWCRGFTPAYPYSDPRTPGL